jgi:hypothetical protein
LAVEAACPARVAAGRARRPIADPVRNAFAVGFLTGFVFCAGAIGVLLAVAH